MWLCVIMLSISSDCKCFARASYFRWLWLDAVVFWHVVIAQWYGVRGGLYCSSGRDDDVSTNIREVDSTSPTDKLSVGMDCHRLTHPQSHGNAAPPPPHHSAMGKPPDSASAGDISWLLPEYDWCVIGQPFYSCNHTQFLAAIKRGDIVWHAMPFNSELELLDASMIDFSIQLTHDLDAKLGRSNTITMSQRDVPGTTR